MTSWSFQTVRRMREAWKRETYFRSQSFSPESAVKYLHVGRRKIQIFPPLGQQDQSNALPQGQQRQSNPHPMPCLPPAGFTLIGALPAKLPKWARSPAAVRENEPALIPVSSWRIKDRTREPWRRRKSSLIPKPIWIIRYFNTNMKLPWIEIKWHLGQCRCQCCVAPRDFFGPVQMPNFS